MTGYRSDRYRAYMESARWSETRRAVLEARGHRCERCGDEPDVVQVHHLTYDRLEKEEWDDLKVVCIPCHSIEDDEREQRVRYEKAYQREFTLWALHEFGPDWRMLSNSGYIERQFEVWYFDAEYWRSLDPFHPSRWFINLDDALIPDVEAVWDTASQRFCGGGGAADDRPSRPTERPMVEDRRTKASVMRISKALIGARSAVSPNELRKIIASNL